MDPITLIGILLGFAVLLIANMLEGGSPAALFHMIPMFLVFGTTIFCGLAGGTVADAKQSVKSIKKAFLGKVPSAAAVIPDIVNLTTKARREGLLALEASLEAIDDEFLIKGVTMAVDGTDGDSLRDILEAEIHAKKSSDKQAAQLFSDMGAYGPTIGIIGTVMGLVHVLENLSNPEALGPLIASAFLATLWGVMSANVIWFPIAKRLKRLSTLEVLRMEIVVEGVLAIQNGDNPRMVSQKLGALLPEELKGDLDAAA